MPDHESDAPDEETALTRTSSAALRRLDTNLEATERVLARAEDRYVGFFQEHEEFFIRLVSRWHSLDSNILDQYSQHWNWGTWERRKPTGLSSNENIEWNVELIDRHFNSWDWRALSLNQALPWTEMLLKRYSAEWCWPGEFGLSRNPALPWKKHLLERYSSRWDWGILGLSLNEGLPWTGELIQQYADRWHWKSSGLSENEGLHWTTELIARYEDQWHWGTGGGGLAGNAGLPWTEKLMKQYANRWEWGTYGLSENGGLPWTPEFIARYADRWHWGVGGLSENGGLPWSEELLERYADRWEWGAFGLSRNESLPWTENFIDRHAKLLKFGKGGLSENEGLPWSLDLVQRYHDRWNWKWLSWNRGVYRKAFSDHITPRLIHRVLDSSGDATVSGTAEAGTPEEYVMKAPIIGTVYRARSADAEPLVEVGDSVQEGDPLCIIEAMNLMNEVKSETSGTIKEVLVEDAEQVEFDQPLFVIDEE